MSTVATARAYGAGCSATIMDPGIAAICGALNGDDLNPLVAKTVTAPSDDL